MAERNVASRKARFAKALNLKLRGYSDLEVSKQMKEEGFKHVSERTIERILTGEYAKAHAEELIMIQLRDITVADIALRLMYRDRLLDKFIPRPSTEINIQQTQEQISLEVDKTEFSYESFWREYGPTVLNEALRRQLRDARKDTGQDIQP